jgi:predicted PurR-regulated permease PerM
MSGQPAPSTRAIAKVFITVAALAGALYLLYLVRSVVGLVFIAVFLAVALGPPVGYLRRHAVPRVLAILLVYVAIIAAIVGVGLLVVPPVVGQVNALARDIPGYLGDLRENETFRKYDRRYQITPKLEEQARKLPSRLGTAAGALRSVTVGVFATLVQLVTVLTMTFFLLLDGRRIADFVLRSGGPEREARWRRVAGDIYRSVSGYVGGSLLIATIAGVFAYVVMLALGVPFRVPLAVLMAFLDLIPLVGATIGGIAILLVTLFNDFPGDSIVWLIAFVVYQQFENNVLQTFVYRRTVNVHPLIVIVAILIGASLLGVLGALVAIPVAATVQIVVRDVWERRAARRPPAPVLSPPPP